MSRIWKIPVAIPEKVEVKVTGNVIEVKGEKGTLNFKFRDAVAVKVEDGAVTVSPVTDEAKALWGTTRSIISNMVEWVSNWYKKSLEINKCYWIPISLMYLLLCIP